MHSREYMQSAFVLHKRRYRESSLILEVFSRDHGRVGIIAKGVKRGGKSLGKAALLQPFNLLSISWSGKGDLYILTDIEGNSSFGQFQLSGKGLISGFYLNELIYRLTHRHDPHSELFTFYSQSLVELGSGAAIEPVLRRFEKQILDQMGYGMNLDHDPLSGDPISADGLYCYDPEQGPISYDVRMGRGFSVIHGKTLIALREDSLDSSNELILTEAKRLMRSVLKVHLGDKPLKSREMFL